MYLPASTALPESGRRVTTTAAALLALLVCTAALPHLQGSLLAAALLLGASLGAVIARRMIVPPDSGRSVSTSPGTVRGHAAILWQLAPVALLMTVFPIATRRIADVQVGEVPLITLILAASVTVPWLSQSVCMPLYSGLGSLVSGGHRAEQTRRLLGVWPIAVLAAVPVALVAALTVSAVLQWDVAAAVALFCLVLLNLVFAQSLVLTNVGKDRRHWLAGWCAYAAALLAVPHLWYLPPLVGLASQAIPALRWLRARPTLVRMPFAVVLRDLGRGLFLGSVLWADKVLLFLVLGGTFQVNVVFIALLPAVVGYSYYFSTLAPTLDARIEGFRKEMELTPHAELRHSSTGLSRMVGNSLTATGAVGAATLFALVCGIVLVHPSSASLAASVGVASWLFMMTTLVCYQLDYVGAHLVATLLGAGHLVLCTGVFLAIAPGGGLYLALSAAELLVLGFALAAWQRHWRTPEFTLFWRHATAW